jgi:hypothetical protein
MDQPLHAVGVACLSIVIHIKKVGLESILATLGHHLVEVCHIVVCTFGDHAYLIG